MSSFSYRNAGGSENGSGSQEQTAIEHAIRNEESSSATVRHFRFGSGASLILMVLIIISIVCFAALSIVSAQADRRLTDHMQEQTDAWRAASNQGQYYLADVDAQLKEIYRSSSLQEQYYSAAQKLDGFFDRSDTSAVFYEDILDVLANTDTDPDTSVVLVYTTPVTDSQEYLMVIQVLWPDDNDGSRYRVLTSKTLNTADYSYDSTLNVMK